MVILHCLCRLADKLMSREIEDREVNGKLRVTFGWWWGGSSQSKRFESWPGGVLDLVWAAIVDRPLEHIQVTTLRCLTACVFIPRATLTPEPLQHLQVTSSSCFSACPFIPGAALAPEPLQYCQVTTHSCA